jgi:hypothetical protein
MPAVYPQPHGLQPESPAAFDQNQYYCALCLALQNARAGNRSPTSRLHFPSSVVGNFLFCLSCLC